MNLISPVQGQPVRSTGQRLALDATGHGSFPVLRDRWGDPELLAAMRGETVETAPEIDVDGDIAEHA
ncbi:hypothetical protein R1A27_33315 (plasmid) [Methylobacterium sp. NMS12]|uniref:hypothetical protein n=1 Tax=Methylobacterium sp. NMS12 TaxID=3079766 RepID=UPI003F88063B